MKNGKVIILTLLLGLSTIAMLNIEVEYGLATLNRFKSYEELKEFLQRERVVPYYSYLQSARASSSQGLSRMEGFDYSKTNIQVEGVDEADVLKTDGEYIYVISGQKVIIVKGYPAKEAAVMSRITVNGTLEQLFINGERLTVFYEKDSRSEAQTVINIYDISDRANPTIKNEIVVDGQYFSSRMIGDYVYVVIRKTAVFIEGEVSLMKIYSDDRCKVISATDVYYSSISDSGYVFTTIVAVNIFEDTEKPNDETILSGWTTCIYVSLENIYLAIRGYDKTVLHRIHIENGEISIAADGEVTGYVLDQFSMDEHEGYFRIATTSEMTSFAEETSPMLHLQNNVYILNMDLDTIGRLESIAPGEQIHSVRFMGDICYLVTFRKTDPLFVIGLSDPYIPKILGELEITGYSDYLHLYDQNHVMGVGKETIAAEEGDFSWYQGVKISLFDITDMTNPEELAKYEIGDRGTDTPVLNDHKAFLFDKEKDLLVLPVLIAKVNESQYPNEVPPPYAYGEYVWQGAYVFTISLELEEKLILRGTVTHIENGDVHNASNYVTRALFIDDVLYTISESKIKMNSLIDLSEIKELDLNE